MIKLRTLAVAMALCVGVTGQIQRASQFRWDWRHAQELELKQNIANANELSHEDRHQLLEAIVRHMKKVMESGANPNILATKTRVKVIDLNADGTPEVIAQPVGLEAGCGATGNCPFWIFAKAANGYDLILEVDGIQVFTIEPIAANDFRDIVLGTHDSASERTLLIFRYSGSRYHQRECYNAKWWTQEGGFHKLPEPRVAPCAK